MTNAEKIRQMSSNELAELFDRIHAFPCEACCSNLGKCRRNNALEPICKNHFLEWLNMEADNAKTAD